MTALWPRNLLNLHFQLAIACQVLSQNQTTPNGHKQDHHIYKHDEGTEQIKGKKAQKHEQEEGRRGHSNKQFWARGEEALFASGSLLVHSENCSGTWIRAHLEQWTVSGCINPCLCLTLPIQSCWPLPSLQSKKIEKVFGNMSIMPERLFRPSYWNCLPTPFIYRKHF